MNTISKKRFSSLFLICTLGIFLPSIIVAILGLFSVGVKGIGNTEGAFALITMIPIAFYFIVSRKKLFETDFDTIKDNSLFTSDLSITFYLCFLIFMLSILFSFNLLITGFFLFSGQVPMGMQLVPEDAMKVVITGIYVSIFSLIGLYYLIQSKRVLKPKKTLY